MKLIYLFIYFKSSLIYFIINILVYNTYDDDDIEFISTKIGSCRPLRSCGKKIIIK